MKKLSRELLAEKILKRRKDFGLTQAQLSEQTGINRLMIGRIEKQEYTPSIEQLESLADVLQFDPTELFITQGEHKLAQLATQKQYKIAVAGTGYVGLSIATLLAQYHEVVAVDIIPEKVELINQRKSPIQDDYIEKYLAEKELNLMATLDGKSAYQEADFVVIAAPTNYDPQKNYFDTSTVESVIEEVLAVNPDTTMIIKSTIPVGYTQSVRAKYQTANLLF
ncbi:helix-turn-helix domain-containing protein, partial [Enterococcus cecorum]|nr:helix-turn-helix domain-containing protein [Enterococcus cecorum]